MIRKKIQRQKVLIDLEFNGVPRQLAKKHNLKNEILQIGAVKLDRDYNITDRFTLIVKPEYNQVVQNEVFKLTAISNGDIKLQPCIRDALQQFESWIGAEPITIYTWSDSDKRQLTKECRSKEIETFLLNSDTTKWVDIQRIFEILTNRNYHVRLHDAIKFCGLSLDGQEHDAYFDSVHTAKIAQMIHTGDVQRIWKENEKYIVDEVQPAMGGLPLEQRKKLDELLKMLNEMEG